jgi:hypothetical protein
MPRATGGHSKKPECEVGRTRGPGKSTSVNGHVSFRLCPYPRVIHPVHTVIIEHNRSTGSRCIVKIRDPSAIRHRKR